METERLFHEVDQAISTWSSCGEKQLLSGVRLICPTPHIAPEAWLHVLYPPVTIEDISRLETDLRASLPKDFRDFLLRANGLELFSNNITVWGIRGKLSRSGDKAWQPFDLRSHNRSSDRPYGSPNSIVYFGSVGRGENRCFFEPRGPSYIVGVTNRHDYQPSNYWPDFGNWLLDGIRKMKHKFNSAGIMVL
jgi:SMI1 / KNR4 family (SUKH-1)